MFSVSVIIPVYNCSSFLDKAILSALHLPCIKEILLIEDGSTDGSLDICRDFSSQYERIKLLRHKGGVNLGAAVSRNIGLLNATSEYVAFLDGDDYYLPNRFDKEKALLMNNPEIDGMYNCIGANFYSESAKMKFLSTGGIQYTTVRQKVSGKGVFLGLIGLKEAEFGHFHLNGLTLKLGKLKQYSICFEPSLRLHQDTEFIIKTSYFLNLIPGSIDTPVAIRGVHSGNRISAIRANKRKHAMTQYQLYTSIRQWSDQQVLEKPPRKHLRRLQRRAKIIKIGVFGYFLYIPLYLLLDPTLILNQTYYDRIHNCTFGENRLSLLALRAKHKLQLVMGFPLNWTKK